MKKSTSKLCVMSNLLVIHITIVVGVIVLGDVLNSNMFPCFVDCREKRRKKEPNEPSKLFVCMLPCLIMLTWCCIVIENIKC